MILGTKEEVKMDTLRSVFKEASAQIQSMNKLSFSTQSVLEIINDIKKEIERKADE